MLPFTLRKPGPGGDEYTLIGETPLRGIDEGQQRVNLLTDDLVNLTVTSAEPLDMPINSTVEVFEQLYTLNREPQFDKTGDHRYKYTLNLEGPQYHLLRVVFLDPDSQSPSFSMTGNLKDFADLLYHNMVRVFSGAWALGAVSAPSTTVLNQAVAGIDTEIKTLSFDKENCLGVLQRLCAEYATEFRIEYKPNDAPNRILHIEQVGGVNTYVQDFSFKYGEGKGLYKLSRRPVQQTAFANRIYVLGSEKNIPPDYRTPGATRLQLPLAPSDPTVPNSPYHSYIEDATSVAVDGLIEGVKIFEEIYPHRTGTVTASTAQLKFSDVDLNFDPMKYKLNGLTPKVHFQTGDLGGYEFEVTGFVAATGTFTINAYKDGNGTVFPSPDAATGFRIQPGDTYVLIDLKMPDEYVVAAENRLKEAAVLYLAENLNPAVEYALDIDELFLRDRAAGFGFDPNEVSVNFFAVGDQIRVVDTELGIDEVLRIIGFTRNPLKPYKYELTLGDRRKISRLQNLLKQPFIFNKASAPTATPTDVVTKPQVVTLLGPLANAARYELFASLFPNGYTTLITHGKPRDQAIIDIVKKDLKGGTLELPVGRIKATGRKYPF